MPDTNGTEDKDNDKEPAHMRLRLPRVLKECLAREAGQKFTSQNAIIVGLLRDRYDVTG